MIEVSKINMEAELGQKMLFISNKDKHGFIGKFGTLLGIALVNIVTFNLGRLQEGGDVIALIEIDGVVKEELLQEIVVLLLVKQIKPLEF